MLETASARVIIGTCWGQSALWVGIGDSYNVGSGDERSVEPLAATGAPATLKTSVDDRPGHDRRTWWMPKRQEAETSIGESTWTAKSGTPAG